MKKNNAARRGAVRRKPLKRATPPQVAHPPRAQPTTVYKFESTKRALAGLPEDARCILLLGGHIVNELTTLNRLLVFGSKTWPDPIEATYGGVQFLTLVRILIGKVAEGLDVFQRRILKKPFGHTYLPLIERHAEGRRNIVRLKRMVGGTGLLRRLRNSHSFHNLTDGLLNTAFMKLGETENWSMLAGSARHTVLFPMSNVVSTQALIDETGIADARTAIQTIRDESLDAADALILFFEHLTIAMADAHDLFIGRRTPAKDTSRLPDARDVVIPPLCRVRP